MTRRVALILLCTTFGLFFAAVPSPAADRASTIVFASQPFAAPGGTLAALLKRDRILRKELARTGITLQFVPVKKGGDAIALMKSGAADIAPLGDMPLLEAAAAMPLTIFARSRFSYISLVGEKGTLVKDLKGMQIGYAPGTNGHFALLKILTSSGLNETDVKLAPMEVTEMGEALLQKKIDAFTAGEPVPEALISANPKRFSVIARHSSVSHLVILQRTADRYPELRFHLAAALIRGINWIRHDSTALNQAAEWTLEDMRALTGKAPLLNREQMAATILRELETLNNSPKIPMETAAASSSLVEGLLFLKKLGKLPADATWDAIRTSFDMKAMGKVVKQPQIYKLNRYDYERN